MPSAGTKVVADSANSACVCTALFLFVHLKTPSCVLFCQMTLAAAMYEKGMLVTEQPLEPTSDGSSEEE